MGAQQSKQSTPTLVDLQHIISTLSSGETPYVFSNLFRGDWVKDHTNPRYAVLVGILNDMCSQLERRRTRFSNNPRVSQKKWKDVVDVCNSDDCESDADSDQPLAQLVKSGNSAGTSSSGFDSQVARKAFFEQPFQSHSNYLTSYMEYVSGIQWLWANDSKSKKKYYSMYHPVVNGSYMGKTRMLHEVLRRLSLGVFLNTSSSKHACPPPNEKVRDWLLKNCGESSKFAIQNLMAFTTAVAAQMVEWLEGFKVKNPFKDQAQIFFAWNEEQAGENSDLFWSKVLETQQAEVGRLTYWGQVRHVKSYGDKKLRKAAKDMLRFEHLATSPTDSAGLTTTFKLQEKALELFKSMGMRIRYMDPKSHDKHIAYVSHLSHISAFMLGKTVIDKEKDEQDIFDMAGSGFESTVRLAKSSPAMWTPIFNQIKKQVVKTLEEYISNLSNFKELLENEDYDAIYNEMQSVNKIKEILNGINIKK